mgnify:CR=1 FL=1
MILKMTNYGRSKVILALEKDLVDSHVRTLQPCPNCKRFGLMTPDHIVPRSLLEQFGIDSRFVWIPDNIQVLCQRCNTFKANRLDFSHGKTLWILKEIIKFAETGEGLVDKALKETVRLNKHEQLEYEEAKANV